MNTIRTCILFLIPVLWTIVSSCTETKDTQPFLGKIPAGQRPAINPEDRDYWPTDTWRTSTPEEQEMDSAVLIGADKSFQEIFPNSYSLLIIRHGYLVFEKYYNGQSPDQPGFIFSITKGFMAALTGICMKEGYLKSVDQKLEEFFPEYFTDDIDPGKKDITLYHMLTHTSGLMGSSGERTDDWFKNTINEKLVSKPGVEYHYSNSVPHLFSGIIHKTTGVNAFAFAQAYLFGPLGITNLKWDTDPKGNYEGANGLYLTPRDMAKFGYLYLNNGYWDGKQIVTPEWVKASQQPHVRVDNKAYGYLLHVQPRNEYVQPPTDCDYFMYDHYGHHGQYIGIIPHLDMIVVMTADAEKEIRDNAFIRALIQDFVTRFINPAVKKSGR